MPTIPRRNADPEAGGRPPLRSSLADAASAVEDRVVLGAADLLRGAAEAVKWPVERIAWAAENWLVWPIQEETAGWSRPARVGALAAAIVLAGAGVAAGVIVSDPSGGGSSQQAATNIAADAGAPAGATSGAHRSATSSPKPEPAKAAAGSGATVLHGAKPDLVPESGGGVPQAQAAAEAQAGSGASSGSSAATATSQGQAKPQAAAAAGSAPEVAGPAATKVARRFAGAFVLYETGRADADVKATLRKTSTPDLSRALLKRPPRLPANVKVPKAKVLNIVSGPRHGGTYTLSVSLLRVGVTSELKLDMTKTSPGSGKKKSGTASASEKPVWKVTDVVG